MEGDGHPLLTAEQKGVLRRVSASCASMMLHRGYRRRCGGRLQSLHGAELSVWVPADENGHGRAEDTTRTRTCTCTCTCIAVVYARSPGKATLIDGIVAAAGGQGVQPSRRGTAEGDDALDRAGAGAGADMMSESEGEGEGDGDGMGVVVERVIVVVMGGVVSAHEIAKTKKASGAAGAAGPALEFFTAAEMNVDVLEHDMVPYVRALSPEEAASAMDAYCVTESMLPALPATDIVMRLLGHAPGTVMLVTHKPLCHRLSQSTSDACRAAECPGCMDNPDKALWRVA
jgi:DNA-directed RNA polymerase subunit H (RpoH/RPB5)